MDNEDTSSLFKDLAPISYFRNYRELSLPKEHFICVEKLPWNLKTEKNNMLFWINKISLIIISNLHFYCYAKYKANMSAASKQI